MEEKIEKFQKKIVLNSLEINIEKLYYNLPFCIENYTKFKFIPFAFSSDLLEEIEKTFKNLKDLIEAHCVPHEEKYLNFDYLFDNTPLIGRDAEFVKHLFYFDNLIDKRTMEKWFTYGARNLKKKIIQLFVKVSKEIKNPYSGVFLFFYILYIYFLSIKKEFTEINFGRVPNDRKDAYFSYFFYYYLKLILEDLSDYVMDEDLIKNISFEYFSPAFFCEIKTAFFRTPFNYWMISNKEYSTFETLKIYELFNESSNYIGLIQKNNELFEEIKKVAICNLVRQDIFNHLSTCYENKNFYKQLVGFIYNFSQLSRFCQDKNFRSDIFKLSKEMMGSNEIQEKVIYLRDEIERKINNVKEICSDDIIRERVKGYFSFKASLVAEEFLIEFFKALKNRRTEKTVDIKDEYENGRLYYFSLDNINVIKEGKELKSAVIYIDIRDFSKKTFKLKEQTIGELLIDKFYNPILHYAADKTLSEDIILHNIVGDSIIFSGSIEEILKLAVVIKKDSEDYKSGLEHIILDETKKELLAFDLGIFIAYGKKPIIFNIPSESGNLNIALGESINLASRGSKSDFNAKRRLDYIIDFESRIRGLQVKLPFNLYIVEGYSLIMPPTLENKLLHVKDLTEERKIISNFFEQLKLDVSINETGIFWSKQKFIYNIGVGLTEGTFLAFLQRVRVFSNIKKFIINVKQLSEITQKKYYFKNEDMEFCFVKNRKTDEVFLFRKEGGIVFKGYDEEIQIWELITKEMPIYNELLNIIEGDSL